jgi:DNA helicase-2/ATP-dependent DNA helicase PcrA
VTGSRDAFEEAVASAARDLLVIAPPGCGKTELLARRTLRLIPELEPHQRILALTYSNKAKANLGSRLREILGADRMRRYVSVRNFHGHATEIIKAHGATLELDPAFERPERWTLPRAMAPWLEPLDRTAAAELKSQIEADLRQAKQCPRTDRQVMQWLQENACTAAVEVEVARQLVGAIHYDDLLRHAQRLMRVPQIAALYGEHYGAVLVDEFQDLSLQQLDL